MLTPESREELTNNFLFPLVAVRAHILMIQQDNEFVCLFFNRMVYLPIEFTAKTILSGHLYLISKVLELPLSV